MSTHREREWEAEDLWHLDDVIGDMRHRVPGLIALPGLASVRDQIAIRINEPTRYKDHDAGWPP